MKAKVCGIWTSAGVGTSEKTAQQFEWNNIYLCVLYTDRKQIGMVGRKAKTIKTKAADLNFLLGLDVSSLKDITATYLKDLLLHQKILIDFDDEGNLTDIELLDDEPVKEPPVK